MTSGFREAGRRLPVVSHCPLEEPAGNTDPVLCPVSSPRTIFLWTPAPSVSPHSCPQRPPNPLPCTWVTDQTLCKHLFSKGTRWKGRKEKILSCSELWSHLSGARCPRKLGEEMALEPEVRHTEDCGRPCRDSGMTRRVQGCRLSLLSQHHSSTAPTKL